MDTYSSSNLMPYTRTTTRTNISDGKGGFYSETTTQVVGDRWLKLDFTSKSDTVSRTRPTGLMLLKSVTPQNHRRWSTISDPTSFVKKVNSNTTELSSAPASQWLGTTQSRPSVTQPDPSNLLLARVKGMKGNLAMVMAEYRQTCSLFADAAQTVYQVGVKLARRDYHGLANVFMGQGDDRLPTYWKHISRRRRAADLHLGYQYGVLPLVNDVESLAYSLYDTSRDLKPTCRRISAQDVKSGVLRTEVGGIQPIDLKDGTILVVASEERSRRDVMYVTFNPSVHQLTQFGLTNPLHLLWQVIPYSFIVDTMFNVGNYLSTLDAMAGVDSWFGYSTQVNEYRGVRTGLGIPGQVKYEGREYSRSSLSTPTPYLTYQPSDSLKQVVNGIALLTQLRLPKVRQTY